MSLRRRSSGLVRNAERSVHGRDECVRVEAFRVDAALTDERLEGRRRHLFASTGVHLVGAQVGIVGDDGILRPAAMSGPGGVGPGEDRGEPQPGVPAGPDCQPGGGVQVGELPSPQYGWTERTSRRLMWSRMIECIGANPVPAARRMIGPVPSSS